MVRPLLSLFLGVLISVSAQANPTDKSTGWWSPNYKNWKPFKAEGEYCNIVQSCEAQFSCDNHLCTIARDAIQAELSCGERFLRLPVKAVDAAKASMDSAIQFYREHGIEKLLEREFLPEREPEFTVGIVNLTAAEVFDVPFLWWWRPRKYADANYFPFFVDTLGNDLKFFEVPESGEWYKGGAYMTDFMMESVRIDNTDAWRVRIDDYVFVTQVSLGKFEQKVKEEDRSPEDAKALVISAVNYYNENGLEKTLAAANDGAAEFRDGDLYVFIEDMVAVVTLAHPDNSTLGQLNPIQLNGETYERYEEGFTGDTFTTDLHIYNPATPKVSLRRKIAYISIVDNLAFGCSVWGEYV